MVRQPPERRSHGRQAFPPTGVSDKDIPPPCRMPRYYCTSIIPVAPGQRGAADDSGDCTSELFITMVSRPCAHRCCSLMLYQYIATWIWYAMKKPACVANCIAAQRRAIAARLALAGRAK